MAPNAAQSHDNYSFFTNILVGIKTRANHLCSATCDELVVRLHYSWTLWIILWAFLSAWFSWYFDNVITCTSLFNADTQVRLDHVNICLSYPYVEDNGSRRYILFYRWISWSLLVVAGIFYIPRRISKSFDNARCKKLLQDLDNSAHEDEQVEEKVMEKVARYLIFNRNTLNGLYWKYLSVSIMSLVVDLFAMYYLDYVLQGRFMAYGSQSYSMVRDPVNFTDYTSQTFPPFVSCELTSANRIVNKRREKFGCHLTLMELYEKIFLGLWVWLIILMVVSCITMIFLFFLWVPFLQSYLLRIAKPEHGKDKVHTLIQKVVVNCRIGDMYVLYRFKRHMSDARFYQLMMRLSDPTTANPQPQYDPELSPDTKDTIPLTKTQDSLRHRPTSQQDPPVNPEYPHQYPSIP